jgi:spore maturation protein SpmA
MVLNYIWIAFFIVAFVVAIIQAVFMGDTEVFKRIIDSTFEMSKMAVMDIALPLAGVMTLWLGIMNIGEKAGAINFMARIVGPFFAKLFPSIPKNHEVHGQLLMNFSANMLGLDNAATPMGLKAMQSLQTLNPKKDTASDAQIMFLALNTSGLTLIPVSVLAMRATVTGPMGEHAASPTDVFIPILIATTISTLTAILFVGIKQKLNLLNKTVVGWIGGIIAALGLIVWGMSSLDKAEMELVSSIASNLILLAIIVTFITGAAIKKVNVYDAFIDGAKDGFSVSIKIIPFMIGILVGIGVFRASGAMDLLMDGIKGLVGWLGYDSKFIDALPTAFMKPLSGSGAKAMMVETMHTFGPDSFAGRLSCIFQGAADTTFYIIALYFGLVGIKKTRYAVVAGLTADLAGVIAAIAIAYLLFV